MKTAVVTGAASGIGFATASRLDREGYVVHAVDIDPSLSRRLDKQAHPRTTPHVGDVSSPVLWKAVADTVTGGIDLLVHNAFTLHQAPLHQQPFDDWSRQFAVMVDPVLHSLTALHDHLEASSGSVVLVSSVHARIGVAGHPAYAAAKGALTALARQMAVEYGPAIRVNSVLPGPIATPVWDSASEETRAEAARATALGRLGNPDEVAHVISFLGSSGASYIDGAEIMVDGGWSISANSA